MTDSASIRGRLRRSRWLAVTVVAVLLLAACGDGDDGDDASEAAATTAAAADAGDAGDAGDAAAADVGCEPGETDGDLTFYNWADYIDEELLVAFEEQSGISIDYSVYESNEQMLTQVESGAAIYDLVVPSDYMVALMISEDLLLPLEFDALPNAANIDDAWDNPPFDPDHRFHVAYQWGTTGIGMTYDMLDTLGGESSWAVIFDAETAALVPGDISMLDDAPEAVSAALKYLGYSITEVIESGNEEAVREAGALLKATNDRLLKYDSVTFGDDLVNGEVDVAHGWSGGFAQAFFETDAYETHVYTIPIEGGVRWVDTMAIPHNSDNVCSAHAMINFLLDAQNGAALTNYTYYGSPNVAATPFILEEILDDPGIYPPPEVYARLELIPQMGDLGLIVQDMLTEAKS
ncbi:polyamine ABC transporter substrate-binding protein [Candidatus Poriferisodalis sp.]|uniref:polyamine ABC transporter substrate-binding protein n=1 Tax=Candidatus Poriferisodalis sp. TaxID=3101277 RepID=UPI003B023046